MLTIDTQIVGYLAGLLTTASFFPQALMTLKTRDTSSLSLEMYALFTLGVLCWLIYGIQLVNYAIIIPNAITLSLATFILAFKIQHTCRKTKRD